MIVLTNLYKLQARNQTVQKKLIMVIFSKVGERQMSEKKGNAVMRKTYF